MKRWLSVLAVGVLAAACYAGVWNYGFASDDVALPVRLKEHGWAGIAPFVVPGAMDGGVSVYYRPFTVLLTATEYAIWGTWPGGYHLTNLVLFALTAALLTVLSDAITGDARGAMAAGAFFAVHPIHTLNVVWMSGRTDLIAALGIVAALVAMVRWRRSGRKRWLAAALVAGLVGVSGKEMGYLLPPLVFVTEWSRLTFSDEKRPLQTALRASLPFLALVFLWGGVVLFAGSFVQHFYWAASPSDVLTNWAGALVLLTYPFDYEPLIQFWLGKPQWVIVAAAATMTAACAVGWRLRAYPAVRWGVLWVGVALLPLYRLTMRWYLLLPSVGFAIALAFLLREMERRGASRAARMSGTLLGVFLLIAYAFGLAGERAKWAHADAVGKTALRSLVELAGTEPIPERLVLTVSPAKVMRMPVFAGNTESFLRVAGVQIPDVRVLASVSLDRPDAAIEGIWMDSARLRVTVTPGDGEFTAGADYLVTLRRRRLEVGDSIPTDMGTVTVLAHDDEGRPIALGVHLAEEPLRRTRWAHFSDGRFVPFSPPPAGAIP